MGFLTGSAGVPGTHPGPAGHPSRGGDGFLWAGSPQKTAGKMPRAPRGGEGKGEFFYPLSGVPCSACPEPCRRGGVGFPRGDTPGTHPGLRPPLQGGGWDTSLVVIRFSSRGQAPHRAATSLSPGEI